MPTSSWSRSSAARRIGSATVVCAAGAGALFGLAGTASAAVPTEQTLEAAPSPVKSGSELTFTGKLTGFGDRPVANQPVDLEWRAGPDQPWSVSNTGTTDANGVATIPATISDSADWRINYQGNQLNDASTSDPVNVQSEQPVGQQIVDAAAAQAGKPYSYGATGPGSFDCSGLTQFAHGQVGIDLPRTSSAQRDAVPNIDKADMQPGDLVFFGNGGSVYHVGIYAGDNKMWAAPESGDVVRLQDIWTDAYSVGRAR